MKKILVLIAIVFAAMQLTAANVDLVTAQQKAQRFLVSQTAKGRFMTSAPTIKWTHEVKNSSNAALAAYYIVNTDKGYVIVSGDDRAREVLAYGDGQLDNLNDLPEAMQFFLDMYKAEMEYLQAHPGMVVMKRNTNTRDGISVQPMLTTTWQQGSTNGRSPYNRLCPVSGGMTCLAGCAAVALAQVMNYWQYPESSPALPGYTGPRGVEVSPLPAYTFDWEHMRDSYKNDNWSEAERDAIANLMRYVGQAEYMDYATDKSGADEDQIDMAIRTFGYPADVHYVLKNGYDYDMTEYYSDEDWTTMMQAELIAGRPLIYCAGAAMSDGSGFYGHAFNVDGYDADIDQYHVNFGQDEGHNGYYAFNAFGYGITVYKYFQLMFLNMQKPEGAAPPRIIVNPSYLEVEAYAGYSETATFTVAGLDLTDPITVTVTDENGYFSTDVATIAVDEATNKTVTVTYAPQAIGEHEAVVTLSTPGAQDVVIPLYGTATQAPLLKYVPVMLPADSANITATSFRADWTDQTPAQNIASYTLEVKTKPNYSILVDADWSDTEEVFGNQASTPSYLLPDGWTFSGENLWAENHFISLQGASMSTPEFTGYDKVTVVFNAKRLYSTVPTLTVSTSQSTSSYTLNNSSFEQYVVVLNCAETDKVTFTVSGGTMAYAGFLNVTVYSGEIDPPASLRATEQGDAAYRLITGITDRFYTVNDLNAEGTYVYKVKAIYTDETESDWSNIEEVTLFDNGPAHKPGDANHDGNVSIKDVTDLIDYLLGGDVEICTTCADVNGVEGVTIGDVTALIDKLLGGNR